MQIIWIDEEGM